MNFAGKALKGKATAVNSRLFTFVGGGKGGWSVVCANVIVGDPLPAVEHLDVIHGAVPSLPEGAKWALRGVTSNERYATLVEKNNLVEKQAGISRAECSHAALIPIRPAL
jgi:hypothetical protein